MHSTGCNANQRRGFITIDYSKAKAFADVNKNVELQKGKMEPQTYSEIKMALEELEGFFDKPQFKRRQSSYQLPNNKTQSN